MPAPSITDVYQGRHPYWTYWSRGNKITVVETERGKEKNGAWHNRREAKPPGTGATAPILPTCTPTTRRRACGHPGGRSPSCPTHSRRSPVPSTATSG